MYHDPRNLIKSSTEVMSQAVEDSNKIITKLTCPTGALNCPITIKTEAFYTSATYTPFRVPHDGRPTEM